MDKIVVAGGSLAGLAVALFAARSGHEVILLEADDRPVPSTAEDVWQGWRRRGVPQFRQLHATQALGWSILAARAPDVLADLRVIGGCEAQLLTVPEPAAAELVQLRCRRPILEWSCAGPCWPSPASPSGPAPKSPGCAWAAGADRG